MSKNDKIVTPQNSDKDKIIAQLFLEKQLEVSKTKELLSQLEQERSNNNNYDTCTNGE